MIDNDQITALAREYAEEINPVNRLNDYPEAKMIADMMRNALSEVIDEKIKDFEGFVRFLLRRYCLVEKSKVTTEYKACASMRDDHLLPNIESAILHHRGMEGVRVLKSLFPEIAKEVEG